MRRYFSERQVVEALWMRALGTLSLKGARLKRVAKSALGLLLVPDTVWEIRRRYQRVSTLLEEYPQIQALQELPANDEAGLHYR